MKSKRVIIFLLTILMAFAMACSCGLLSGLLEKTGSDPAAEDEESTVLGEEYRSEFGGFSFQQIPDYEFTEAFGMVQMAAEGANPQTGPGILFTGGLNTDKITVEDAIKNLKDSTPDSDYDDPVDIEVDGEEGVYLDFSGEYEGEEGVGRVVIVMVGDYQQFICVMTAPPDEWDEVLPLFEDVLDTVRFFEPDPDALDLGEGWEESEENEESPTPVPTAVLDLDEPQFLRQWAVSAVASDQYGDDSWSASQATGEPNVDDCGDSIYAWAAASSTSYAWIELTYATPVNPTEINIYQSYNPSGVVEVDLITTTGEEYIAWTGTAEAVSYCPDQMTITLDLTEPLSVQKVRVYIDQSVLQNWTEIDAVELVGMTSGNEAASGSQLNPVSAGETAFSFGYSGCDEVSMQGTDAWVGTNNQLLMIFDGGSIAIPLPDDWKEHKEMDLGAFVPWETPLPTLNLFLDDVNYFYATDSGYIWWDYSDADHITGMVDFYAIAYDSATYKAVSPSCQVGGWIAFSDVPVD